MERGEPEAVVLLGVDVVADPEVPEVEQPYGDRARTLSKRPANVSVQTDLPFDEMQARLARARVVALPVLAITWSALRARAWH